MPLLRNVLFVINAIILHSSFHQEANDQSKVRRYPSISSFTPGHRVMQGEVQLLSVFYGRAALHYYYCRGGFPRTE